MKCQDLQLNLPVYFDDILSSEERATLQSHLDTCPLCRQKLAEIQELRNRLRSVSRRELPANALNSLRALIASRLVSGMAAPTFQLVDDRRKWLDVWLMPYAVGAMTSLIVGFSLLWLVLSAEINPPALGTSGIPRSNSTVLLAKVASDPINLTPLEYANSRSAVGGESPSINPQGALVAWTESLDHVNTIDDEVVVVADVFGNGVAQITEVVEPSSDRNAIPNLEKALESDSSSAAFVPADFDRRSATIRVVLKIQSVNIDTNLY
ncbi:MAG: anti-sigma factor family protein [Pyrinomonadaceae bacterium]|nr:zf-HC2 domain-containing protein [Blastocatellia bacterium]MDQ3221088.1 anti-sigma factor [Acidobacteriota bacterium]